jgi:hypothetical protein
MQADTMHRVLRFFMRLRSYVTCTVITVATLLPSVGFAAGFSDVPTNSALYPATEYLKAQKIIQEANTFNPDQKLTRAQAAKVLVAPLVSSAELAKITSSQFGDIPSGQWFTSYVEAAR